MDESVVCKYKDVCTQYQCVHIEPHEPGRTCDSGTCNDSKQEFTGSVCI